MIKMNTPKPSNRCTPLPKSSAFWPPPKSVNATGIRVKPIMVTTEPVTTGGKSRMSLPNKPEKMSTNRPEAIMAP
ncbi:hypothetical protein D3C74_377610 [compost metagenome]